jgi:hypothetical protein
LHVAYKKLSSPIRTESEGLGINGIHKKPGVSILISDKIDFKSEAIKIDNKGNYIMVLGSILHPNIYKANINKLKNRDRLQYNNS